MPHDMLNVMPTITPSRFSLPRGLVAARVAVVTLMFVSPIAAHGIDVTPGSDAQTPPAAAGQAEKPQPPPPPAPPPPLPGANVKVDITITDQAGTTKPIVKTLSVIVADRSGNQIRSHVSLPVAARRKIPVAGSTEGKEVVDPQWRMEELPLNIDLRAEVVDAMRVKLRLVLNYRTAIESTTMDGQPPRTSNVTEEVNTFLETGKPTIISQSADAATDRKVTVEVKATIQR